MTDDELGRLVRDTWIAWALEQPDIADHPGWITPWDALSSRDKEVDIRIAYAVFVAVSEENLA